jgi:Asp-tRNA(Asn)/Glu-tRNA(Gln) amidotransferase B subunit
MSMRIKNNESKYRYIPETNIASIDISKLIDDAKKIVLLTPDKIKKRLEDLNINENFIKTLLNDFPLYKIFNKVFTETNDPILSST